MRHCFVTVCLLIATNGFVAGKTSSSDSTHSSHSLQGSAPAVSKKLLFLTHAALYKHSSLAPAEKAVVELGARGGFAVTTLEGYKQDSDKIDLSVLTPEYLAQFDGVMLMT